MSFNDIKGQDRPIKILKGYIAQSKLAGGYLFSGPEGIGKKLVAINIAKLLNCEVQGDDPCGHCASCIKIDKNEHPDVHTLGGEDEVKIEQIRRLKSDISLKPYEGKVKVFIIDRAHTLTAEASNALLKTLEEPPQDTLIILITDKQNLIFKTIISRCKVIRFSSMSPGMLKEIISADLGLDNNTAHFLAHFSEGRMGMALGLKDSDILREKNRVIDAFALSRRKASHEPVTQDKNELRKDLNILAGWFRDIYLMKVGAPYQELINFDRKEDLLKSMGNFTFMDLNDILDTIRDSMLYLEQNVNARLLLNNLEVRLWKD